MRIRDGADWAWHRAMTLHLTAKGGHTAPKTTNPRFLIVAPTDSPPVNQAGSRIRMMPTVTAGNTAHGVSPVSANLIFELGFLDRWSHT